MAGTEMDGTAQPTGPDAEDLDWDALDPFSTGPDPEAQPDVPGSSVDTSDTDSGTTDDANIDWNAVDPFSRGSDDEPDTQSEITSPADGADAEGEQANGDGTAGSAGTEATDASSQQSPSDKDVTNPLRDKETFVKWMMSHGHSEAQALKSWEQFQFNKSIANDMSAAMAVAGSLQAAVGAAAAYNAVKAAMAEAAAAGESQLAALWRSVMNSMRGGADASAGVAADTGVNRAIDFSDQQLQSKFKHAVDFGIEGNYNPQNAVQFGQKLRDFVQSAPNPIQGTYRGQPANFYVDPQSGLMVMTKPSGEFWTTWKLSPQQLWNVLNRGKL